MMNFQQHTYSLTIDKKLKVLSSLSLKVTFRLSYQALWYWLSWMFTIVSTTSVCMYIKRRKDKWKAQKNVMIHERNSVGFFLLLFGVFNVLGVTNFYLWIKELDDFCLQVHQLLMPNQLMENKKRMSFHDIIPFSSLLRGYRRVRKGIRNIRWTPSKVFTQDL